MAVRLRHLPFPLELLDASYLSLTSLRTDGSEVSTPLWCAASGTETMHARTAAGSPKVRRIAANRAVRLAPCLRDGTETGPRVEAIARVLPREDDPPAHRAIVARHGVFGRLYEIYWTRVRGTRTVLLRFSAPTTFPPSEGRLRPTSGR